VHLPWLPLSLAAAPLLLFSLALALLSSPLRLPSATAAMGRSDPWPPTSPSHTDEPISSASDRYLDCCIEPELGTPASPASSSATSSCRRRSPTTAASPCCY
jgi:hypothetical protein